jgi:hypothetical protein
MKMAINNNGGNNQYENVMAKMWRKAGEIWRNGESNISNNNINNINGESSRK